MGGVHLINRTRGDRHLGEIGECKERGAVAVIDIMIVVGDVVGERGDLSLDRRISAKLEILPRDIGKDRLGHRLRGVRPKQRPVMLDQPLERFKGQVQPVEARIFPLELGDHAQRLGVMVEAALPRHGGIEGALAGMAEGRMAEIVRKGERLGEVLIHLKRAGKRSRDLRHFETMGEPRAVMVALVIDEDLRLIVQPAKGGGMEDAVAVAPIGRAGRARGLIVEPATASARIGGIGRKRGKRRAPRAPFSLHPLRRGRLTSPCAILCFSERLATPKMSEPSITLSARAAQRIVELLKSEAAATLFRVSVEGGGCSGFQYRFDLVKERAPDDLLIERDGARVVVDPVSLEFVQGSEIDFVDELIGAQFKIKNPNVTASCGCGTSFSV